MAELSSTPSAYEQALDRVHGMSEEGAKTPDPRHAIAQDERFGHSTKPVMQQQQRFMQPMEQIPQSGRRR